MRVLTQQGNGIKITFILWGEVTATRFNREKRILEHRTKQLEVPKFKSRPMFDLEDRD